MSDQTINPVFAPTITNAFYSLDYIIFKEKINNGMLCQVNTVNSFGGWVGNLSGEGSAQKRKFIL